MQLVETLLITVATLALLSSISLICGSSKKERPSVAKFAVAVLGAAVWTLSIAVFLILSPGQEQLAQVMVFSIIAGVTLCEASLLMYAGWKYKNGKLLSIIYAIVGAALVAILALQPDVFYTAINLDREYTQVVVNKGWYYAALIVYYFSLNLLLSAFLLKRIGETTRRGLKTGLKVFYAGLSIGGILALIFNLVLITQHPEWTWIGPIGVIASVLSYYYSAVRFKMIDLSSRWMKILSMVVLVTMGIALYMLLFYIVFAVLFRASTPSIPVLALNITMALVLLLAMPAVGESISFMKTLIYTDRIDLSYIVKKLEATSRSERETDLREVARFLADSMHYSYVAFVINGRSYASDGARLTTAEIGEVTGLECKAGARWILPEEIRGDQLAKTRDISRVGVLTDAHGREFGKVVFGAKTSKVELTHKELAKHEAIVGMLAAMIEEG